VAAARRNGRGEVGCIVLGRGEDEKKVDDWLRTAAGVPGFIGFAVGRTTFWDPLIAWRANRTSREEAVAEIARRYRRWSDIFQGPPDRAPSEGLGRRRVSLRASSRRCPTRTFVGARPFTVTDSCVDATGKGG
jgi:5-dehydro-2-deoxygluconokinase